MSIGGRKMEELIKQVNEISKHFFQQEAGNRLSDFAWISFQNTLIKTIRDYKIEETNKEVKK